MRLGTSGNEVGGLGMRLGSLGMRLGESGKVDGEVWEGGWGGLGRWREERREERWEEDIRDSRMQGLKAEISSFLLSFRKEGGEKKE